LGDDADHSFCNNFCGLFRKKINGYRHDKRLFSFELLIPGAIILVGILLTRVSWFERSPAKFLTPDLLPLPQKIIMNEMPINDLLSDISVRTLGDNLPDPGAWDIYYRNETDNLLTFSELARRFG